MVAWLAATRAAFARRMAMYRARAAQRRAQKYVRTMARTKRRTQIAIQKGKLRQARQIGKPAKVPRQPGRAGAAGAGGAGLTAGLVGASMLQGLFDKDGNQVDAGALSPMGGGTDMTPMAEAAVKSQALHDKTVLKLARLEARTKLKLARIQRSRDLAVTYLANPVIGVGVAFATIYGARYAMERISEVQDYANSVAAARTKANVPVPTFAMGKDAVLPQAQYFPENPSQGMPTIAERFTAAGPTAAAYWQGAMGGGWVPPGQV